MPVVRVPVVHKFGIVSVSRAEQLLREGRRDKRDNNPAGPVVKTNPPTKISQHFIEKYNKASDAEREKLDRIVNKTLSQAKYKAGLHKSQSSAARGGVPEQGEEKEGRVCDAWLELILLCQCYGPHQEEVLLALAVSLNQAPLSNIHIPSLLYMSGLCYQWLKSDLIVSHIPSHTPNQLRTGELLLLRILYLISLRLYYHQMVGTLQDVCTREDIRQLKFDLQGFESRERVYRNFPEALLHWKVALEVGQIVVEINSPVVLHDPSDSSLLSPPDTSNNKLFSSRVTSTQRGEREGGRGGRGGREVVCPLLRHSLEVWRAVRGQGELEPSISRLAACPTQITINNWMESVLAVNILGLGSQLSLPVLTLLHSLSSPPPTSHPPLTTSPRHQHQSDTPNMPLSTPCSVSLLQDTPTSSSQASQDDSSPTRNHSLPTKKGTRFMLPGPSAEADVGSVGGYLTPDSPAALPGKHRGQVDTLNVLGLQPGFREPYPDSVYSEPTGKTAASISHAGVGRHHSLFSGVDTLPTARAGGIRAELESVATQSLVGSGSATTSRPGSCSQNHHMEEGLGSGSTLGETSPSRSLAFTFSRWLKSSTSRNLDSSRDDHREADEGTPVFRANPLEKKDRLEGESDTACGTPIADKLEDLASTLGESLARLSGDLALPGGEEPVGGRSVTLSAFPRNLETRCTHYTHSSSALSGWAGVPGSHVAPSTIYRQSLYSPLTIDVEVEEVDYENGEDPGEIGVDGGVLMAAAGVSRAGFESWPREVGLAYTLAMGEVVLYGRTSHIQSAAVEGGTGSRGERVLGLRQLAEFSLDGHGSPSKESECMAWMVRHCAILGLSRGCHAHKQLAVKDGLGGRAWCLLTQSQSTERDSRVLEAYKISQVYPDVDGPLLAVESAPLSSPLLAHMASHLARTLLPATVDKFPLVSSRSPPKRPRPKVTSNNLPPQATAKVDTHHKGSVCPPHHKGFSARTLGALQDIVERDWRREMRKEREQEQLELGRERPSATPSSPTQES